MTPHYNSIRTKKYKNKFNLANHTRTPNVNVVYNGHEKENFTLKKVQKRLFQNQNLRVNKANLSLDYVMGNANAKLYEMSNMYKLKNESSDDSDLTDPDDIKVPADRNNAIRQSLSSFCENAISEQVVGAKKTSDMNSSIRKKNISEIRGMFKQSEVPQSENTDTYASIESSSMNEESKAMNPNGYTFNTLLPKEGLSKYNTTCPTKRDTNTVLLGNQYFIYFI